MNSCELISYFLLGTTQIKNISLLICWLFSSDILPLRFNLSSLTRKCTFRLLTLAYDRLLHDIIFFWFSLPHLRKFTHSILCQTASSGRTNSSSSWKDLIGFQPLLGKSESLFEITTLTGQMPFVPRLIISALCLKPWCYFHFYAELHEILKKKAHPQFQKSKVLWAFLIAYFRGLSFWK